MTHRRTIRRLFLKKFSFLSYSNIPIVFINFAQYYLKIPRLVIAVQCT